MGYEGRKGDGGGRPGMNSSFGRSVGKPISSPWERAGAGGGIAKIAHVHEADKTSC